MIYEWVVIDVYILTTDYMNILTFGLMTSFYNNTLLVVLRSSGILHCSLLAGYN